MPPDTIGDADSGPDTDRVARHQDRQDQHQDRRGTARQRIGEVEVAQTVGAQQANVVGDDGGGGREKVRPAFRLRPSEEGQGHEGDRDIADLEADQSEQAIAA